ncbi:hypothetical protein Nepgr_008980 [Nepenthes gracilis]|uniref:FAS1 domain-containing protein n=1 Tax=Nepenthes gracilis TaxID=150966 RepID=A0AAD3XJY3_NEPGR|nr:hypothetical protein Nepgr_008980 [Nepenthes gracilis]
MSSLLSKGLSLYTIRNVLSLHVLVDYYGTRKIHRLTDGTTLTATMFQATGSAPGNSGYVNITDLSGGKVGFGAADDAGDLHSFYVKSVEEMPYTISVIQISQIMNSAEAEAPTPEPSQLDLTAVLATKGCKAFAALLTATGAAKTFQKNIDDGLTVFCVSDSVIKGFMPKYNNLTDEGKLSLVLYQGLPAYNSMGMFRSSNGVVNTLATDGSKKYDLTVQNAGEDVSLNTKIVTAKITGTLLDMEPLAVYKIDKVLLPRELFKAAAEPASAPDTSDDDSGDDTGKVKNASVRINCGALMMFAVSILLHYAVAFL